MKDLAKTIFSPVQPSKYPRTPRFTWSKISDNDDRILKNANSLIKRPIVITEKLDGSNQTITNENIFARSHSKVPRHPSMDQLKSFHATIRHKIPPFYQIFLENLTATHTIQYTNLPTYFFLINVRDLERNLWLSWKNVECMAEELGIIAAPKLFEGSVNSVLELCDLTNRLANEPSEFGIREGVVVRLANGFNDSDFQISVAKLVSKNFKIDLGKHWSNTEMIKNRLKK